MSETDSTTDPTIASGHTAGPWRVEPDLSNIGKGGVTTADGHFFGTADDYEWGYLRIEDAHLIAAAPSLLAACKELRDALAGAMRVIVLDDHDDDRQTEAFVAEMARIGIADGVGQRADAAIARAEGHHD